MSRPQPEEFPPYFATYINLVPGDDIVATLIAQTERLMPFWRAIPENAGHPAGKWSVKQAMNHIIDAERIFSYRALRFGRGDQTPLASFDQDAYVPTSRADERAWQSLVEEHEAVRRATLALLQSLPDDAWARTGPASSGVISVLALAYVIAGHELHHEAIFRSAYGLG